MWFESSNTWLKNSSRRQSSHGIPTSRGRASFDISQTLIIISIAYRYISQTMIIISISYRYISPHTMIIISIAYRNLSQFHKPWLSSPLPTEIYHRPWLSSPLPTNIYHIPWLLSPLPTDIYHRRWLSSPLPTDIYLSQTHNSQTLIINISYGPSSRLLPSQRWNSLIWWSHWTKLTGGKIIYLFIRIFTLSSKITHEQLLQILMLKQWNRREDDIPIQCEVVINR